ncbi:MAG: hypothetical protein AMXMBFR23_10900 [Chloroflexota bacterium]
MRQRDRRPAHDAQPDPSVAAAAVPRLTPGVMRSADIAAIQQAAGNRAARRAAVQRSVDVGAADHPSEAEADRVARDVVANLDQGAQRSMPEEEELLQGKRDESLQRSPADESLLSDVSDADYDESPEDHSEEDASDADAMVARQADGPEVGREGGQTSHETAQGINRAKGGGRPLPEGLRGKMEQGFGADFSQVRVHADGEAQALNKNVGAKAFTTGSDIFFGKSGFNPASSSGQELLAHELTHVVQQGAARSLDEGAHAEGDGHQH